MRRMTPIRSITAAALVALLVHAPELRAQRVAPAINRAAAITVAPQFGSIAEYNEHVRLANLHGRNAASSRTRSLLWALVTAGVAAGGYQAWNQAPEADADGNGGETRTYIAAGTLGVGVFTLLSAWNNLGDAGRYEQAEAREVERARKLFPERPLRAP